LIERLVDEAATRTRLDPLALRRAKAIGPDQFPWATPPGARYDSGDHPGLIDTSRQTADWDGFAARQGADRERGLLRGIGAALFVEVAGGTASTRDAVRLAITGATGRPMSRWPPPRKARGRTTPGCLPASSTTAFACPSVR